MGLRGTSRRQVVGAGGRRYIVCGFRGRRAAATIDPRERAPSAIVAWLSGATLVLAVTLSAYAIAWPPALRRDSIAGNVPISAMARYSFADFLNAAR